jgi:hypothetical protein
MLLGHSSWEPSTALPAREAHKVLARGLGCATLEFVGAVSSMRQLEAVQPRHAPPAPVGLFAVAGWLVGVWRRWRATPAAQLCWGLPWLERKLGAPFPGAVLIVGARTNVGKSFWVLELAATLAALGQRVAYVSAEDAPHEVGRRLELVGACDELVAAFPEPRLSAVLECIEAAGRDDCKFVVVDYVQVLGYDGEIQVFGDVGAVSRTAAELKAACKRAGVVGVLVSQLRRPSSLGGGPAPFPTLHELKGSGDLENIAEWVVLLGRSRGGQGVVAEIAKSKNGEVGSRQRYKRGDGGRLTEFEDAEAEGEVDELG